MDERGTTRGRDNTGVRCGSSPARLMTTAWARGGAASRAAGALDRTRRELAASLALAGPDSPARVPILAHLAAIEAELAARPGRSQGSPAA